MDLSTKAPFVVDASQGSDDASEVSLGSVMRPADVPKEMTTIFLFYRDPGTVFRRERGDTNLYTTPWCAVLR